VTLHVVHSAALSEFSDRNRDFHQAKVKRFFGMFVNQQGGSLASFSGNTEHLRRMVDGNFSKVDYGRPEMGDGKFMIFEVLSPTIERQDKNLQTSLWDGTVAKNQPAPTRAVAPMDISIAWSRNVDVDLYTQVENDAELFFGRTESAAFGGRFLKDIRSLPGANVFETVTYAGDVPLKRLRVFINHYGGVTDAPVDIELRIRVLGSIYAKKFRLPPGQGTRGAGDRNTDSAWVRVNVAEIVGL